MSSKFCHRFVGYLEEEAAVLACNRAIENIEAGKLPERSNVVMPDIKVRYRSMWDQQRAMKDLVLLHIRDSS